MIIVIGGESSDSGYPRSALIRGGKVRERAERQKRIRH